MRAKKTMRLALAVLGCLSASVAMAQTNYVAGPVDNVSVDASQVTVLGQTYIIDPETIFHSRGKKISGLAAGRLLSQGNLVAIESVGTTRPLTATSVVISGVQYVAGASMVFLGGNVEKVDLDLGALRLGSLVVDISATHPAVLSTIKVGSYIEVAGIQPSPQGLLLVASLAVSPGLSNPSESNPALDLQSIGGTGSSVSLHSIGGTGSNTSLQSIGGTGKSASLQSIGGTGSSVSLHSIGGTGSNTSLQSIGGTGKSASLQSIGGTGSNVSLQSIGGTGTNTSLQSIGGTGKSASLQSIGGTGTSALSE